MYCGHPANPPSPGFPERPAEAPARAEEVHHAEQEGIQFKWLTNPVEVLDDGWTVVTKDRKPSAHFEHAIAILEDRTDVLTMV